MVLKEFALSEVCLLKKEAKVLSASKYVCVVNSNSSDPPSAVANKQEKNRKKKKNTDLNKNIITQSFSYNH